MLLSTAFFPPVQYFALIADGMTLSKDDAIPSVVYIDASESYQKQSYRNRCIFFAADGPQSINIPIVHNGAKAIRDIQVDYSTPWVIRAERAIASAYESSAYFEYYKDDLFAILDSKIERLFDLNLALIKFFLEKTGIVADIRFTDHYTGYASGEYGEDYRDRIHPKRPDTILSEMGLERPYFQVFAAKHGFKTNLSIMDLLFNEGPDSIIYLKKVSKI